MQFLMLLGLVGGVLSLPTNPESRQENLELKAGPAELPSHLLKMEHRGPIDQTFIDKVLSSKTISAVDSIVSSVINLAGGVVDDFGNLVVSTIDQLPKAIREITDTVGAAVDGKREQVVIMIKGIVPSSNITKNTPIVTGGAIDRVESAVEDSQFQFSLSRLESTIGSFFGKLIGATYNRAEDINNALSDGIRRIAGAMNSTATGKGDDVPMGSDTAVQTEGLKKTATAIEELVGIIPDEKVNEI